MPTASQPRTASRLPMTTGGGDHDPTADDAHPALAQEAAAAISGPVLRLAFMTGAQIVHTPPWPGAPAGEEQPEPGAGIQIAQALERAAGPRSRDVLGTGRRGAGRGRDRPAADEQGHAEGCQRFAAQVRVAQLG
jgi:hypothetical protein